MYASIACGDIKHLSAHSRSDYTLMYSSRLRRIFVCLTKSPLHAITIPLSSFCHMTNDPCQRHNSRRRTVADITFSMPFKTSCFVSPSSAYDQRGGLLTNGPYRSFSNFCRCPLCHIRLRYKVPFWPVWLFALLAPYLDVVTPFTI